MPPAMFLVKKHVDRLPHPVAACPSTITFSHRDDETTIEYLIDTGASRSLLPKTELQGPHRRTSYTLQAANGSQINTYGLKQMPVTYDGRRYTWKFLVADVTMPIIGADFLTHYSLAVDVRNRRLLPTDAVASCVPNYVSSNDHPVADASSETCAALTAGGIDLQQLADEQRKAPPYSPPPTSTLKMSWLRVTDGPPILCDTSTGTPRPWIPVPFRRQLFEAVHGLAHPSKRATASLLKQKYVWDSITRDAKNWTQACVPCQRAKVVRHTETGIGSFQQPTRRFGHIHVDIVGPLPVSRGARYIFTTIDRSTRWPEAIPMTDATTDSCVTALIEGWIAKFGLPDIITSDRGSVFTSSLWTNIATRLGVTTTTTTAYNPEANGMIERLHRTLKAALMSRCASDVWKDELPWVLLGLRTTPREPDNFSPAERVYGESLTVPADFFRTSTEPEMSQLRDNAQKFIPSRQTYHPTRPTHVPEDLLSSPHVFVRVDAAKPPLTPPYTGPYKVLQRRAKSYLLQLGNKRDWISIDRLKPAYLLNNDQPEVTFSRAGRPLARRRPPKGGSVVQVSPALPCLSDVSHLHLTNEWEERTDTCTFVRGDEQRSSPSGHIGTITCRSLRQ